MPTILFVILAVMIVGLVLMTFTENRGPEHHR